MNTALILKRWLALGKAVKELGPDHSDTQLHAAAASEIMGVPKARLIAAYEARFRSKKK